MSAARPRRPDPILTEDNEGFWLAAAEHRLVVQQCRGCGRRWHPPRAMCPDCASTDLAFAPATGRGTVYSFSLLHHPQHPAFDYPVVAALVDLDEGVRLVTNLLDVEPAEVRIGMRVEVTFADGRRCIRARLPRPERRLMTGTVIAGIGRTEWSKDAGRSETQLAAEAITDALHDAGLSVQDLDGLVSYTIDPVEETELVRALGARRIGWSSRMPYGGAGSQGVLQHAAAAVTFGAAEVVVAYRAIRARSQHRFGAAQPAGRPTSSHSGSTAMQWCSPFGVLTPASWMSLNATRYMHASGATSEDFGRAVVQLRAYAATNPWAHFHGRPITLEDHQASRWIAEPAIRLFDCCQETDGAAAVVVTRADRGAGTRAPVAIAAAVSAAVFEEEIASNHYRADLAVMDGSVELANRLFSAGITRADVDVALVYDAFTPILFMQLEGLGFCEAGEARHFVADGHLGPTGSLPCNTNGGLIGEGYIHGMNLTLEAVRQLRGEAPNQVVAAQTALVAASRTGVLLQRAG